MILKCILALKSPVGSLLLLISSCFLFSFLFTSFTAEPNSQLTASVKQQFMQDLNHLQHQAKDFTHQVNALQQKGSLNQAQEAFHRVKRAYKQVEYLVEYLDPEVAKSLNGAPLPKVLVEEANYQTLAFQKPSFRTFPPHGLQVLEELLFSEDSISEEQVKEAIVLAYDLEVKINLFQNSLAHQSLTPKQLLDSQREELLRVMTMGITGFDAPGAGQELPNCAVALKPVLAIAEQQAEIYNEENTSYAANAAHKLKQAITYLQQHPNFDTFDRLYFIREMLDPAYAALTALQQQVLQTGSSVAKPVNDKAMSLFSANFLQTAYYAKQDRQQTKPELIELGKTLFFDPLLSANNKRSCA
ncbi:MAG: cytochrome-c peroxidase, partial [Bacteroidota bacterium]|nr:cytochrome-c peroxidase [Bacteroidota bacterium]